ncbi:flagellar motor protein MotB [Lederbergia sp. NSJ-179]|uniref:flagellar motor protein MotB n=1 Tax=Lederbergia sp. NSJ-179 TaxID=2931402 RepID=UPI001FD1ECC3|nr:flagellar motor protein MotB [Lederbergia sp. NSJ-179]MCJ7840824.1 flagellar motor protein MotB [Lederbergia sp. NSJ-179]
MSKRRRKKRGEKHGVNESWLLPYSDLMTLLLALFIVLFSTSMMDAEKFQQMSQVFNGIFLGGTGQIDYQNPVENDDHSKDNPNAGETSEQENENQEEEPILDLEEQKELEEIQAKINSYIKENKFNNRFATSLTGEGLLLTIRDNVLFESGKAEVREEDEITARELAKFLEMDPPRNIIISGHTDNVPIQNAHFSSNWELSVMRAINFMKILLEDKNLDPRWFSAKGFGEYQPVGDNSTAAGRAQNRRVEVLILPRVKSEEK